MSGRRYSGKGSRLVKGAMGAAGGTIAGGNDVVASRRAEAYEKATGQPTGSPHNDAGCDEDVATVPDGAARIQTTRQFKKPIAALRKLIIADLAKSLPNVSAKTIEKAALRWMLRIAVVQYAEAHEILSPVLAFRMPWIFDDEEAPCAMGLSDDALRSVIEAADAPALSPLWADDYALGWIFEWSTEGEREALDAKVNAGGKIDGVEIARKTQFFTDRYMVEWLTQNSLGLTWLCMCRKHGWTADAEAVLPVLDARRAEWRAKRDAGDVALDALMPIHGELEDAWKYYVPQPLPEDAIANTPASVRELKILDPAVGCGFFLFTAFDALVAIYREEARHRGETWGDAEIAKSIVENNLHGADIDAEVTRIAAAMLWLKGAALAPGVSIARMNLVCADLGLHGLAREHAHVVATRAALSAELDIPNEDLDGVMKALVDARTIGTLMKIEDPIQEARDRAAKRTSASSQPFALEVQ